MLKSGVFNLALLALAGAMSCPDGGGCDEGSACCQVSTGRYGCCPLPRSFPMVHASFGNEDDEDTVCPDETRCPLEYSCVKSHSTYQCCPLAQGVSCSDGKHCCPEDHMCTADGHSCIKKKESVGVVVCPDGVSECPEQSTCCQLPDDRWGCCPMAKAVCCEDRVHCCPEGSTCDTGRNNCHSPTQGDMPMWEKLPARRRVPWEDQTVNVKCDSSHTCPDGYTCCKGETGDWACCPMPEAVCCDDHVHCCPKDTICNVKAGSCDGVTGSRPWLEKVPSLTRQAYEAVNVKCDSSHACPDGFTCCKRETGDWACCPIPEAVCCDDHVHCCPKDTICNVKAGSCDGATGSRPWLEKVPSLTRQPNKAVNVKCDSSHTCPDRYTCCKGETGDWTCCPMPEAVCCSDIKHCCPTGYTCDLTTGTCSKSGKLSWDHWGTPFRKGRPVLRP